MALSNVGHTKRTQIIIGISLMVISIVSFALFPLFADISLGYFSINFTGYSISLIPIFPILFFIGLYLISKFEYTKQTRMIVGILLIITSCILFALQLLFSDIHLKILLWFLIPVLFLIGIRLIESMPII